MRVLVHDYAGHPFQFDLSRALARRGHWVTHMYFAGDPGPKGRAERQPDDPEEFSVKAVSIGRPYAKADLVGRWRNDLAYGFAAAKEIARLKPDVVISGNTPLDAQSPIIRATHANGGAFVNWVQDFYGLAIERLIAPRWAGIGRAAAKYYRLKENAQLKSSDALVLISEGFREHLPKAMSPAKPVAVIPNWGALADISTRPRVNAWSDEQGLSDGFVFLYSGTLGLKHNPDLLLALADAFAGQPAVRVVVAAAGLGFDRLRADLAAKPRANLTLLPLQPFDRLPDMLGSADVLVALLERDAGEFSVPSKVQSYLCAGRAILLSAPLDNPSVGVVLGQEAGEVVPPDDVTSFIEAARRLYADGERRGRAAQNGRAYAEKTFDIERVASEFEAVFEMACQARR